MPKVPPLTQRVIEYVKTHPGLDPELLLLIEDQIEDSFETEVEDEEDEGLLLEEFIQREEGPPVNYNNDELLTWSYVEDRTTGSIRKLPTWSDDV